MLRHQLAVAERERPRAQSQVDVAGPAWLALLAGTQPIERLAAMRLIVTPGTILRWHREILRRRWARLSRRGRSGRPPVRRNIRSVMLRLAKKTSRGDTGGSTASWRARHHGGAVHGVADPQERRDRTRSAPGRPGLGRVPAVPGAGDLALDFFTTDLLNGTKVYVLAVIEHGTRRIRILGATEHPVRRG